MKPATPLPWGEDDNTLDLVLSQNPASRSVSVSYLYHAANAYPKLVEALRECKSYLDALPAREHEASSETYVQIKTLLRELGEL